MDRGSALKQDPALRRGMRFQLFKKAIFGEVLIGVDWDPAKLKTANQLAIIYFANYLLFDASNSAMSASIAA